jgi:hypothetical protein
MKTLNPPAFKTGDLVRIKSKEMILKSVYPSGRSDGCPFTKQMWNYCGNVHTVLKVVESFFDERRKRSFQPRSTIYILQNVICDGRFDHGPVCDHSCFLMWHQDWLDKV